VLSIRGGKPALKHPSVPWHQRVQETQAPLSSVTHLGDVKSKRKFCLTSQVLATEKQAKQIFQVISDWTLKGSSGHNLKLQHLQMWSYKNIT